jgi:hypothetical protein
MNKEQAIKDVLDGLKLDFDGFDELKESEKNEVLDEFCMELERFINLSNAMRNFTEQQWEYFITAREYEKEYGVAYLNRLNEIKKGLK